MEKQEEGMMRDSQHEGESSTGADAQKIELKKISSKFQNCEEKVKKLLEIRKAANDDDDDEEIKLQSKRKYQPTVEDQPKKMDDGEDLSPVDEKGEADGELSSGENSCTTLPTLECNLCSGSTEEEQKENQSKSDEMNDFENRFTWTFWTSLHETYGSYLGYAFGFAVILLLNLSWMLEEIGSTAEGHSVSKTFVIMFILYSYSFITLGLELIQFVFLFSEIYAPYGGYRLRQYFKEWDERYPVFQKMRSAKHFNPIFVTIFCMFQAFIGSVIWNWFWWNHICKAYHDRTCKKSWIGQLVIAYRDDACYDGYASPIICEKLVSYLPILLLGLAVVFLANVLMPLINDRLSLSYIRVEVNDIDAALDIVEKSLKNEGKDSKSTDEVNSVCNEQSFSKKEFNFSKTDGFDTNEIRIFTGTSNQDN